MASSSTSRRSRRSELALGFSALAVGLLALPVSFALIFFEAPLKLGPALLTALILTGLAVLCFGVARSMLRRPTPREIELQERRSASERVHSLSR